MRTTNHYRVFGFPLFIEPITNKYLYFPLFIEPIKEHVSTTNGTTIRHEFTHKSTSEIEDFDSTLTALDSTFDNATHFEELQRAREASENIKQQTANTTKRLTNSCRLNDRKGQRLCCSAESSPILSRSMIASSASSQSSRQQNGSPHRELRTNSITPRLVLQNIDKVEKILLIRIFCWVWYHGCWILKYKRPMSYCPFLYIENCIYLFIALSPNTIFGFIALTPNTKHYLYVFLDLQLTESKY